MGLSENQINIAVVNYCRAKNIPVVHIANERKCSSIYGSLLRKKGTIAGVSDLLIFHPKSLKFGLWLELKKQGGKLTLNQKIWLDYVKKYGYYSAVADNVETAINIIDEYVK